MVALQLCLLASLLRQACDSLKAQQVVNGWTKSPNQNLSSATPLHQETSLIHFMEISSLA